MSVRMGIRSLERLCGSVKGVELAYSAEAPLGKPIILNVPPLGIRLSFHPHSQRLIVNTNILKRPITISKFGLPFQNIQVYDFSKISLRYW